MKKDEKPNYLLLFRFRESGDLAVASFPNQFDTKYEAEQEAIKRLEIAKNSTVAPHSYCIARLWEDVEIYVPPPQAGIIRVTGRN